MTEERKRKIRENALKCKGLVPALKLEADKGVIGKDVYELVSNLIDTILELTEILETPKAPPSQGEWSKDNPEWKGQD